MARPCSSCKSEFAGEINRKIKSGSSFRDISRWLKEVGDPITGTSLSLHARNHLGKPERTHGRKPVSADFLETVRDAVHEDVVAGKLRLTVRDGLSAQAQLDARLSRNHDRDLLARIAMALTGNLPMMLPVIDPDVEAIEADYRPLLTSGAD